MRKLLTVLILLTISACALIGIFLKIHANLEKETLKQPPVKPSPNPEKLFNLINGYREENGLTPFEKNNELCSIAEERSRVPLDLHKGFLEKYSSYPYKLSENVTTGISPEDAFNGWKSSSSHNAAMLANWKYACVSCNITCVTIFSSFER